jgi:predicted MPP superfamily phosphohydrolase
LIVLYVAAGLTVVGALDAFLLEPNWLKWERIDVPIAGLPSAFDGYRIALLADLHYPRWTNRAFVRRALTLANKFDPDLLAIPGDICDRHPYQDAFVPSLAGLFDMARTRDGIVATLGNHDHGMGAAGLRRELAAHTPVRLIENRAILIERDGQQIAVGGVGDLWDGIVAPFQAFADVPPGIPRLLLSHNPDVAEFISPDVHVDLMLSGHTHGGQVRFPFGPAPHVGSRYGNKFRAGLVQGKGCRVYVTRGVCSARHVRFWCPPEVTGITLRRAR